MVKKEKSMNTLKDMILTEIEGEWYAVPVGEAAKRFSGMIRMNKTGKRIFELLMEGKDQDGVVRQLMEEYEVDEETAAKDVAALVASWKDLGLLED